jgi:ADP-ribose pyrophosphatase YjhB (NUDIX family)
MRTLADVEAHLATLPSPPEEYGVVPAGLIFNQLENDPTNNDKLILLERGDEAKDDQGLLTGMGGAFGPEDTDLHDCLRREAGEEIGNVQIEIDEFLAVVIRKHAKNPRKRWVLPIFLARAVDGTLENMEEGSGKCAAIHQFALPDIPGGLLSPTQAVIMDIYARKYGDRPYYQPEELAS